MILSEKTDRVSEKVLSTNIQDSNTIYKYT